MNNSDDFIQEINIALAKAKEELTILFANKDNKTIELLKAELLINNNLVKPILEKYKLPEFKMIISVDFTRYGDGIRTKWSYKGCEVEPDDYYLRPDNYKEPKVLDILRECQNQDTPRPNIRILQDEI